MHQGGKTIHLIIAHVMDRHCVQSVRHLLPKLSLQSVPSTTLNMLGFKLVQTHTCTTPPGFTPIIMQMPRKAESFSSLSRMFRRDVHLPRTVIVKLEAEHFLTISIKTCTLTPKLYSFKSKGKKEGKCRLLTVKNNQYHDQFFLSPTVLYV